MNLTEWVNSLENPTRVKYDADRLRQQGIRSGDREVIILCYGYTEREADLLCARLKVLEAQRKDYNPDIGF